MKYIQAQKKKLLGVSISNTLCWDKHIDHVLKSCNSYLYLLTRIKIYSSLHNRILFYDSYILPHLDSCCIIWGSCISVSEDKLIKFQKRAARIILYKDYNTPSTELFTELNWTTFPERVLYQKSIAMYKIVNNICPDYLKNHIAYTSEFNSRDTRSSTSVQFYNPKPNCELFRRSCMYSGAAIWNSLPCDVKSAISANSFKN